MKRRTIAVGMVLGVLVVRAADAQTPRFTLDTSSPDYPVVTDNRTGLVWQGCAAGYSGPACATVAPKTTYSWQEALDYCEKLTWPPGQGGYSDWRLPNRRELMSIVDHRSFSPAIDGKAFPNTFPNTQPSYWSSSSYAGTSPYPSRAWRVNFYDGNVFGVAKTDSYYVRCVRSGP